MSCITWCGSVCRRMAEAKTIRTTVTLDRTLLEDAQRLTGIEDRTTLLREALRAIISKESAMRLIAMGGTDPDAWAPPRRRVDSVEE